MHLTTSFTPQSTAELIGFLRHVSVFAEIPDEVLTTIATLVRPVAIAADAVIFEKGDPGDCMYIIAEGRVRVHDGELVFNHLGPYDVFGEISVLDMEVRSATITAEVDTFLYRLDQKALYDLMSAQPDVAHKIIQVLSRYLRGLVRDMADDFEYMQQFARVITAAQAVEAGNYEDSMLDGVVLRSDALGQLARVFQRMAHEVKTREWQLRRQVESLQIEIDKGRYAEQVASITDTDYFRDLQQLGRSIRRRHN